MDIRVLASGSAGNCYRVSDGQTHVLIECGLPLREIQRGLGFRLAEIHGVLVSHEHMDHARAAADLLRRGVDVYMTDGTAKALGLAGHRLRHISARVGFRIGTIAVVPFDTVHDAAEPVGFLLASGGDKLLYLSDTAYCKYRFPGLTQIMIEANWSSELLRQRYEAGELDRVLRSRIIRNHMSLERALEMLKANDLSRVREVWLLHLSNDHSDEMQFKRRVQEVCGVPVYIA